MRPVRFLFPVFVFAFSSCLAVLIPAQDHTWSDKSGNFNVEAVFVEILDGNVKIKRSDNGKVVSVPLERLSEEDQKYARKLQAEKVAPPKGVTSEPNSKNSKIELNASLKWSDRVEIDKEGKRLPPNIQLVITATGEQAKTAVDVGFLKLNSATDSNGDSIELVKPLTPFFDKSKKFEKVGERGNGFFEKHPTDGVRATFELVQPKKPFESLQSAKGSFKIRTGGKRNTIKVEKVLSKVGIIESEELKKAGIEATVTRNNTDSIAIKLSGNLTSVYRVAVLDPEGEKLKDQNGSSRAGGSKSLQYSFAFNRSIPGNATVFIYLASDMVEREIKFDFSNLPLPKEKPFGF